MAAMSEADALSPVERGGIGDCASCRRVAQREAMVPPRLLARMRSSRVTSEFGAPPLGVVPWQVMHFAASTPATSHGRPLAPSPPPVPGTATQPPAQSATREVEGSHDITRATAVRGRRTRSFMRLQLEEPARLSTTRAICEVAAGVDQRAPHLASTLRRASTSEWKSHREVVNARRDGAIRPGVPQQAPLSCRFCEPACCGGME